MADKKLREVRTQFVEKVSRAVICAVLDDLQEKGILNDGETEEVKEGSCMKREQARTLIDGVRRKGPKASLVAIQSISSRDAFLAEQLGLTTFLEDVVFSNIIPTFYPQSNMCPRQVSLNSSFIFRRMHPRRLIRTEELEAENLK